MVVDTYNPSYLGDGGRRIMIQVQVGESMRPYLKTN
jgi:hypothetical protein